MLDFNSRPDFSTQLTEKIDQALQDVEKMEKPRDYLGGSYLGKSCDRALQYGYLNTPVDEGKAFSGRALRIFQAGHVFEDLMVSWLQLAGFEIYTEISNGNQYGWSALDGRLQGHIDGIIAKGPRWVYGKYPALFEAKSLNNKSWNDTVNRGVTKSKPIYASQIALYQAYMEPQIPGISDNPALFTAINKDTSEVYFEWVPFNAELAQKASDRGLKVLLACDANELLPRVTANPEYFECRFCSWRERCWNSGQI